MDQSVDAKHEDYKTAITALCNDSFFHEHLDSTWLAIDHIVRYQLRFLFWMYFVLLLEIALVVLLTYYFGSLSRYSLYRWTFGRIFLGRASHWQLLLTGYAFPVGARPRVEVDAMTTDDHLYQGTVGDYFLNGDGELSGILLKSFKRFKRAELEADRVAGRQRESREYWKDIPGANFYLPADKIANLNIRYEIQEDELLQDIERLLKNMKLSHPFTVSLETRGSAEEKLSDQKAAEVSNRHETSVEPKSEAAPSTES